MKTPQLITSNALAPQSQCSAIVDTSRPIELSNDRNEYSHSALEVAEFVRTRLNHTQTLDKMNAKLNRKFRLQSFFLKYF
jgi:hypothetical protein